MKHKKYRLIEHTADICIAIWGKNLKELFNNAALAMFDIIAEWKSEVRSQDSKKIILKQKADNLEELFINWLNELLSLSAIKDLIFYDFKIDKLDENNLEATVTGSNIRNYRVNTEVKAATYHQLKLEKTKSGWQAKVIFDV